jgi:PPOX class probable F420-dependent enzyme
MRSPYWAESGEKGETMSSGFKLGQGRGMTPEELRAFLMETKIFAKLGTLGEDGWPNVNPAWYEYDGEAFWLVTKELAGFCRNMRRDPRVTICIDNPEPPYRRVMVRGRAEFPEGNWIELARRMVLRYLGPEGMDYFEATLDLPRVLVRVVPERVTSWDGGGVDRTFTKPARWHEVTPDQSVEDAASS